jgi:hypothetical protein
MIYSYSVSLTKPRADVAALLRPSRAQIEQLEDAMLEHPQVFIPVVHRFAPGLYIREITVPADTVMTGRVHRHEHFSAMVSGEMSTLVDGNIQRISGYRPFIAPPGTKRVGYTHTPVVWLTCHHNPKNLRDIEQIEAMLCEPLRACIEHQEAACLS